MLAYLFLAFFAFDRLLKFIAVVHFFRRPPPPPPNHWPTVTLIQPITRSENDLRAALWSRARLVYPAPIQHLFICDENDAEAQALCRAWLEAFPSQSGHIITVPPDGPSIASKVAKLQAAPAQATGEVLCFVDDDIALCSDALNFLVPPLYQPEAGATFGLACYTRWSDPWSSLMSAFVNAQALLSYIPLTYLTEPFTITGHCFALRREVFDQAGGFTHMPARIDDDHELARRVRGLGRTCIQTPLIYDVDNRLTSPQAYAAQMKRWFVIPQQAMWPHLQPRERAAIFIGSLGALIPSGLGLWALLTWQPSVISAFGLSLGMMAVLYALCEKLFLKHATPLHRWPAVIVTAIVGPLAILVALFSNHEITWRGQRLRVKRGGEFEVL